MISKSSTRRCGASRFRLLHIETEILYNVCMQENYNIGNIAVVLYASPVISTDFDFTTD